MVVEFYWDVVTIRLATAMFTNRYGGKGSRRGYAVAVGMDQAGPLTAHSTVYPQLLCKIGGGTQKTLTL